MSDRWAAYSKTEGEPEVLPVLVIQVPDKANSAKLGEIVQTVEAEWPMLGSDGVAHVFGEHEPVVLASRTIHWVYPESIQGDTNDPCGACQRGYLNRVGTAREQRFSTQSGRQRTQPTSLKLSAEWSASPLPTELPPTMS